MPDRPNRGVDRPLSAQHVQLDGPDGGMDDELLFRSATARTTPEEERAVADWRARSAANERRFRDTLEILRLAADAHRELNFGPAPAAEDLFLHQSRGAGASGAGRRHGVFRRLLLVAAAAAAGMAATLVLAQRDREPAGVAADLPLFGPDEFATEAEPATVGLRDGSVVRLAPETRLRVHTRQDGREVSLDGRGFFAVAADPTMPFTVHTDAGTVTVLGTRFDLAVAGEDLRLIVIEGKVQLSARGSQVVVQAGQLAQVLKGNLVPPIDVPDPASLVGWIGNFIAFRETPLRTVVSEIEQRYGVRVELSEPALADRTVTALFAGRSYEEIVEIICVVAHLRCTTTGDILRMAPAP